MVCAPPATTARSIKASGPSVGGVNSDSDGGGGVEYPQTLMKAAGGIKGVETVITGHTNTTLTWNDFKEYGEFMRDLVAAVEQAKKEGKTAEQAAETIKLPDKYKDYGMGRLKADVTTIYGELK